MRNYLYCPNACGDTVDGQGVCHTCQTQTIPAIQGKSTLHKYSDCDCDYGECWTYDPPGSEDAD